MVPLSGLGESMLWDDGQQRILADLVGASWGETFDCLVGEAVSLVGMESSGQWQGAQPYQSRDKPGFPGPAPGQVQDEAAR